jgi:very-short-patch-repair endonuclease
MLAGFLRYAKSGGVLLHGAVEPDIPLNAFEADVKDALERRGLKVQAQFGALRFRIDLVVMHPQNMCQPVLAVECDGATYHSSYTARDRDKIRQEQLERLGWVFHRIWSSDWFRHRDREVDRLIDAYNVALAKHTETTKTDVPVLPKEPHARLPENVASPVPPVTSATDTASPGVRVRRPIEEYTIREIDALFDQMAIDGVPIVRDVYVRQATLRLGYQRTGKVIKAILSQQYSRWKQRRH